MLEPWIKNPGGLDADNFIQSGSVVRGTYVYHRQGLRVLVSAKIPD